jgi:ABC-2 type transport system ATP-binding protein
MLNISTLSHSFGSNNIFENLNLTFAQGKITGIVGQNGIGKTTLFRIMSHIYALQSGEMTLSDQKLQSSDLVFMPTEPYFYPFMKGKEYINIVANSKAESEKATHYANILSLPLEELVDNYSTGMRKKLAFSALFSLEKPVIILDEPYNGVDLESNEIIKHIIKIHSGQKIVLLSSHILSTITDVCHQVYHFTKQNGVKLYLRSEFDELQRDLDKSMQEKMTEIERM